MGVIEAGEGEEGAVIDGRGGVGVVAGDGSTMVMR